MAFRKAKDLHNLIQFGRQADRQLNETNCPLLGPLCLPEAGACLIPILPQTQTTVRSPQNSNDLMYYSKQWCMALAGFCVCEHVYLYMWLFLASHFHSHTPNSALIWSNYAIVIQWRNAGSCIHFFPNIFEASLFSLFLFPSTHIHEHSQARWLCFQLWSSSGCYRVGWLPLSVVGYCSLS